MIITMGKRKFQLYSTVKTENPKFKKYLGLPQMSYSAYTSWNEPQYKGAFIASKFLGIPDNGNIFTDYGGQVGEYLETRGDEETKTGELLSLNDIMVLDKVNLPEGSEFEREIMIRREKYCIIGFIDRCTKTPEQKMDVIDYKTGGIKKSADYGGPNYNQTRLYSYALQDEGESIGYVGVELLHRKGNNLTPGDKNVLRLEGTIEEITTPYVREETEKWLEKSFDKTAQEISDYLTFYQKYFVD